MASHIYLVGKSTSRKTAFGEFAVARWPGGQSHLSSRKIYISENRLWRIRGGQVATHIYLVGKSTSQETAFGEFAVARWPGGQSDLSSGKSTFRRLIELQSVQARPKSFGGGVRVSNIIN